MKKFLRRLLGLETAKEYFERNPKADFFITWEGRLIASPGYINRCVDKAIAIRNKLNENQ